jgi:hypothetical protein
MNNKYYIFVTPEGSTKAPHDSDAENLQLLGISQGSGEKEVLSNLLTHIIHLSSYVNKT